MSREADPQGIPVTGELFGRYRIVSKLGHGGMGVVYRAHDEVLQRDVALKVLREGPVAEKSSRENLLREARAASALSHPNICTIHEVAEFEGGFYMVMELIEGKTISALMGSAPPGVTSILRYGVQLAGALAHAHGRNLIHRDLKSANIVVTPQGLVKILDFGLARRMSKLTGGETTVVEDSLESAGKVEGTLYYMAPEILRGESGDFRSDLWALGVVLYEMSSGKLPFQGRTMPEISSAILREPPSPLSDRIPPGLWSVVQRCMAKEPAQRYQRAGEVQAALEAVQSGTITTQVNPSEQRGPLTTTHRGIRHLRVKNGDVLLMIGTTKGLFLLRSSTDRRRWDVAGPYFHGLAIYSLAFDNRDGRHRMWAATNSFWGSYLRSSDDFGKVWTNPPEANIKFPSDCGVSLKNIWQICVGRPEEPEVMYCGVDPAALFESRDAGETWSLVRGLFEHPHRPRWVPGNGGLCLHTILLDPMQAERMFVGISSAGVYRTSDGGRTWEARNRGIRVVFKPDKYPEFGQCVHKIAMHPARPERLFLQNHWGLYRSDESGENWKDIAHGVPSDFGFAIVVHPHNPDCVYVLPVESDEFRCTPEGRLRVYRTRNAGSSWEPLMRGLPQKGAYETVLRDAMTADSLDPHGLYFGTRTGKLYGSTNEGKTWEKILEGLPSIVCVKSAIVGEPRPNRSRRPNPARATSARSLRADRQTGKGKKLRGRAK